MLTGWRLKFLGHCSRCAARGFISPIHVYYLSRLRASNVYRFTKRFTLAKVRSRKYSAQTITESDYANIALLANTRVKAESLLHSLEREAGGIGLHVNTNKTEYMCFNQRGDISTLNGGSLELVDKFTYLGNSISSTENDTYTRLVKAWEANDRLLVVWKTDLSDKIKKKFFQPLIVSVLLYGCITWTLTKYIKKKLDSNCTLMLRPVLHKSWRQSPTKQQRYGHLPPILKTIQIRCGTLLEKSGRTHMRCTLVDPFTWTSKS